MTANTNLTGPASHSPSIGKIYGKPVAHSFKVLDGVRDKKHMEQVALLKTGHKIGHGHANAFVAHHKARHGAEQVIQAVAASRLGYIQASGRARTLR